MCSGCFIIAEDSPHFIDYVIGVAGIVFHNNTVNIVTGEVCMGMFDLPVGRSHAVIPHLRALLLLGAERFDYVSRSR